MAGPAFIVVKMLLLPFWAPSGLGLYAVRTVYA